MPVLFQIGLLAIEVAPFNFDEVVYVVGADFAAKEVIGAQKPREFTGQADSELSFRGRLFPQRIGGLDQLDLCESMATSGVPQMVVRGDGRVFGWYDIEKLEARHGALDATGIGREIAVDVRMVKSPSTPSAQSMLSTIFSLFG